MSSRFISLALAVGLTLGLAGPASASPPDWSAWAPLEEVEVLTTDGDGELREHTIWLAVSEGTGYLRTSQRSTWGDNLERDGQLRLRGAQALERDAGHVAVADLRVAGALTVTVRAAGGHEIVAPRTILEKRDSIRIVTVMIHFKADQTHGV